MPVKLTLVEKMSVDMTRARNILKDTNEYRFRLTLTLHFFLIETTLWAKVSLRALKTRFVKDFHFFVFSVKPFVTKNDSEKHIELQESDSISLPCTIHHSNPTPTVSWWIQTCSTPCNPSPGGWTRMETANTSSLQIPPSNEHALYKCTAENLMGYDYVIYTVTRQPGRCRKGITSTFNRFLAFKLPSESHLSWSAFRNFLIVTNRF